MVKPRRYRSVVHELLIYTAAGMAAAGMLLCANLRLTAQNIDSVVGSASRSPINIANDIKDPVERSAFHRASEGEGSGKDSYPGTFVSPEVSAVRVSLAVAEAGARSSFDLGDFKSGLDYAHLSLSLLPENPLLLVAVADVQAALQQNEAAIASARDALDYLDRFDRPARIPEHDWPDTKRKQQGTAWFVIGRALVNEALQSPAGAHRISLLEQAAAALKQARALKPGDMEIVYLLGIAYLYANDASRAAIEFATVYQQSPELAPHAQEQLSDYL